MNRLLRFLHMFLRQGILTTTKVALRLLDRRLEQAMDLLPQLVADDPVPRFQQVEGPLWHLEGARVDPIEIV